MTGTSADPLGTLALALAQAMRLLDRDPPLAIEQADEILKVLPDQPDALALKGLALGRIGKGDDAIEALRRAVHFKPSLPDVWRALADHYSALEMREAADEAFAQHLRYSTSDPKLMVPALALSENRIPEAEASLREHLRHYPTDVAAIRMLAEVAARIGRTADAEVLLARCLELAPGFKVARQNYAMVLHRANKPEAALQEVQALLAEDPTNPGLRNLKAAILGRIGEFEKSIQQYKAVLADYPRQPRIWMSLGHALKTAGQNAASIDAYRRCIELTPRFGEVWWSLANLKTYRFSSDDIATMRAQLERTDLTNEDRFHFDFALGKALEDTSEYAESFEHYRRGNALRRKLIRYDAEDNEAHVARSKKLFTPAFFAARSGMGCPAPDPIFVVGLPRSGSTLIEQILATHSQVEGTQELPDVTMIARIIGKRTTRAEGSAYPRALERYSADELRAFGEQYLAQTRIQRKTDRPFFIDKMPNNFAHVGLIHLMLPNSRIVDARRHPLGCCFSCFKQHFARGQSFTYDLAEIGRYYRNYVELMDHFDAVLPGRVHRVFYENMVEDTEGEIRRLLEYCGLPFEDGVLRFHENQRAVRTASSEQVRRPIFREGVDQWRHYEPWLDPLKQALGSVLEKYPVSAQF
ncbi:MAG TPA: sulfotransferase [Steroidobacteraceae bacterium]|nr:sulfotransferase [Steroidobacteraceae bacterium]